MVESASKELLDFPAKARSTFEKYISGQADLYDLKGLIEAHIPGSSHASHTLRNALCSIQSLRELLYFEDTPEDRAELERRASVYRTYLDMLENPDFLGKELKEGAIKQIAFGPAETYITEAAKKYFK